MCHVQKPIGKYFETNGSPGLGIGEMSERPTSV